MTHDKAPRTRPDHHHERGAGMSDTTIPRGTYTTPPVIRSYVLSVDAFDHLKAMQRTFERREGARLTNSQALERLLNEHQSAQFEHSAAN